MKREFKRKEEPVRDFTAKNLIESIDNQVSELEKNSLEIETLLRLIQHKKLTPAQEKNIRNAMDAALELSSNIQDVLRRE